MNEIQLRKVAGGLAKQRQAFLERKTGTLWLFVLHSTLLNNVDSAYKVTLYDFTWCSVAPWQAAHRSARGADSNTDGFM